MSLSLVQAQDINKVYGDYQPEEAKTSKMIFSIAAHGDMEWSDKIILYPGAVFDASLRIWHKDKWKSPRIPGKDSKFMERELYVKPFVGFHVRPHFHTAIFAGGELAFRLTTVSGIYGEVALTTGYMHTKYNDPVYEWQPDGSFKKVRAGEPHVMVGGNFTAGFDLSKISGAPIALFAGLGLNQTYPNNTQWTKYPYLRVGTSVVLRKEKAKK
jgi:hypothetical protein